MRAGRVCGASSWPRPWENIQGTRAKLKRLVKLGILTEAEAGSFARQQ
jgi:hypothetical protein